MRSQDRIGTIGLPPGNQTTNCAYFTDYRLRRLIFVSAVLRISSYIFCPDEDTRYEHKTHVQLWMALDYQWYINIKCNGVIQNVGTDVSEKHFRTKSVSALHPILQYICILSPGVGTYSNFEIVIIIFELKNIGWVSTTWCFSIEETYSSTLNWENHVYLCRNIKSRILSKRSKW